MKNLNYKHHLKTINNRLEKINVKVRYKYTQAGNDIYGLIKGEEEEVTYYSKTDLVEAVNKIINKY